MSTSGGGCEKSMSKKPKIFVIKAVTANDAANGLVVFRTPDGSWSHDIAAASVAETEDAADTLLVAASQDAVDNLVIDPYLIDVAREDGTIRALKFREAIRAEGPTVGFALVAAATTSAKSP
jgi:hypothetical protein